MFIKYIYIYIYTYVRLFIESLRQKESDRWLVVAIICGIGSAISLSQTWHMLALFGKQLADGMLGRWRD